MPQTFLRLAFVCVIAFGLLAASARAQSVIATLPTGFEARGVAITPDGKKALVANFIPGTVSVIDLATKTVVSTIQFTIGVEGIAITPDGSKAFVTNNVSDQIYVIDLSTNSLIATVVPKTKGGPIGVAITSDGLRALVTLGEQGQTVSVIQIDAGSFQVIKTISTPGRAVGIAITPDNAEAWVSSFDIDQVSIIDIATLTRIVDMDARDDPQGIAITPDGKLVLLVNAGDGSVTMYNALTRQEVANIPVGIFPRYVAITPSGSHALVPNVESHNVSIINIAGKFVQSTTTVGFRPVGVAITPDGTLAVVSNSGDSTVSILSLAGLTPQPIDTDADSVPDVSDNCPLIANPNQLDSDGDGLGNLCDPTPFPLPPDADNDGVPDTQDNCPNTPNINQLDSDTDGLGDVCDPTPLPPVPDTDTDGILDNTDNCPLVANADQLDSDNDGVGNVCDSTPNPPPAPTQIIINGTITVDLGANPPTCTGNATLCDPAVFSFDKSGATSTWKALFTIGNTQFVFNASSTISVPLPQEQSTSTPPIPNPAPDSSPIVINEHVLVDFNPAIPVCSGDPDFCNSTVFSHKKIGAAVEEWKAVFNAGDRDIIIKNGATISVARVPNKTNNQSAPGIEIYSSKNIDIEKGGAVAVSGQNNRTGNMLVQAKGNLVVNGNITNNVGGSSGLSGSITLASLNGTVSTGPESRITTYAASGGNMMNVLACGNTGDVNLKGLLTADYKNGTGSRMRVASFGGTVSIDSNTLLGTEAGTKRPIMTGVSVTGQDPVPGSVEIQAKKDIVVAGNVVREWRYPNYGAVAVKTSTNSSRGGTIRVRSLNGSIRATDRAFDNAGRFNASAMTELLAKGDIALESTGRLNSVQNENPAAMVVVNTGGEREGKGGLNTVRSFAGSIFVKKDAGIYADAPVLKGHPADEADGVNRLTACGNTLKDDKSFVLPPDANTNDDTQTCAIPAPEPLFADCASLGISTSANNAPAGSETGGPPPEGQGDQTGGNPGGGGPIGRAIMRFFASVIEAIHIFLNIVTSDITILLFQ